MQTIGSSACYGGPDCSGLDGPGDPTLVLYVKLVLFQLVWLACAFGAAYGYALPGAVAGAVLVGVHVAATPHRAAAILLILVACIIGAVAETALIALGLVRYEAAWPDVRFVPVWMVALWAAFAATSDSGLKFLGKNALAKAAVAGLVAAPFSYLAGERVGALVLLAPRWQSLAAVGVVWAVAYPLMLVLERRGEKAR